MNFERLFVRLPNWVGDVVMATPVLRALREHAPRAEITVGVKESAAGVLKDSRLPDHVLTLTSREENGLLRAQRFARRLRPFRFDAAILLTNSLTSALPLFLARIPVRIGYTGEWRGPFLTHRVKVAKTTEGRRRPTPMPAYYQALLDAVGIKSAGPGYELPVTDAARAALNDLLAALPLDSSRPLVALNPGARYGQSKLWLPERFAEVARRLAVEFRAQVVVLCGPGEEELARSIALLAGPDTFATSSSVIPLDLLPAFMDRIDLLVTTDSGPRHFAVARGRPVIVVMGPTHPEWTSWNLEQTQVLRHDVPCGPCHLRICPTDHRCMQLIGVEDVMAAAARVLPRRD